MDAAAVRAPDRGRRPVAGGCGAVWTLVVLRMAAGLAAFAVAVVLACETGFVRAGHA